MEKYTRAQLEGHLAEAMKQLSEFGETITQLHEINERNLLSLREFEKRLEHCVDVERIDRLLPHLQVAHEMRLRHARMKGELELSINEVKDRIEELQGLLSRPPEEDGYYRREKIRYSEPH